MKLPSEFSPALILLILLTMSSAVGRTQSASITPSSQDKHGDPLAIVSGKPIYDEDVLPYVQGQLFQLRVQEFDVKNKALEDLVNQKLLESEGQRRGTTTEKVLEQEVDAKVPNPTDAELQALYIVQKQQLGKPFEEIKPQLNQLLKQARVQQARQDYYKRLRDQAGVSILLKKPTLELADDPARLRGNPKAPVLIIEFSDFECPYCQAVEPTLRNLLSKYKDRVKLAYRDLPLREIHPQAELAAEAARCASDQSKFWEYHDLLFQNQNKLTREGLLDQARTLKLDEKQFDSCLASGKYKTQVEQDRQLGLKAGLSGTPGFFVNGKMMSGNLPQETFEKFIDGELGASDTKRAAR
jgi:protein-disulfide isomerase